MLTQHVIVKDQFGVHHTLQATVDQYAPISTDYAHVKHITFNGEDIRPSFEMFFQSTLTSKIFKIIH